MPPRRRELPVVTSTRQVLLRVTPPYTLCPNDVVRILVVRVVRNDAGLLASDLSREVDIRIRIVSNRYLSPKPQALKDGYQLVHSSLRTISFNEVLDSFYAG